METATEISPEIQKGVKAALGDRFQHGIIRLVKMETKGEKKETGKTLVLKNCRAFILSTKSPPKLELDFNYLEVDQLESLKPNMLKFKLTDRKEPIIITAQSADEASSIIDFIAVSLKRVFPHTQLESFFEVKLKPTERYDRLQTRLDCMSIADPGPCDGFSQMYNFMCDYHGLTYMEEVAWDIDTIYLSQDTTDLCLNDFDHLESKDLVPIISGVTYNNWFKRLSVRDIKLSPEATKEVVGVVRLSSYLEQLVLDNTGFRSDFAKDISIALQENTSSALVLLDFSNNTLEDRGIKFLCTALATFRNSLMELSLANTGMTALGASALGKALLENNFYPTSLVKLNLSRNPLKDGDIEHLLNFLAQPNHLNHLDLSDCGISLDNLFSALFRGCLNVTHINFANNVFTNKKVKDVIVPKAVKQFFATTTKLQSLNMTNCKLLPEVIKEIMLGIGSNKSLESVELNLSSNELKSEGAKIISSCIADVPNISSLNLSDNDFNADMASLVAWLSQNKVLRNLDLSHNLNTIRPKNLSAVLDQIVDLIQDEQSPVKSLSIARCKLRFETIPIINALGSNVTLTSIDISGNQMGDIGARMLAKALQINCKLETIIMDNNGITSKGFQDIANALERNYSLKSIPPPVSDLSNCYKSGSWSEKSDAAFQRIQQLLQRNHSPQKFADAQAFRLQQGFLYTTSHQLVDKLVVQIQDAVKELSDCDEEEVQDNINKATNFIKDADNSKQLLEVLRDESRKNESDDVTLQLRDMATQIHNSVEEILKKTATGMIGGTEDKCPNVMGNESLRESVVAVCQNRSKLPEKLVPGLIEQLNAQLNNQMSEANLAMAAHISDTIIDEIIEILTGCYQKLAMHLSTYRDRTLSLSLTNGPCKESDDAPDTPDTTAGGAAKYARREVPKQKTDLRDRRKSVKLRPKSSVLHVADITQPTSEVESNRSKPSPTTTTPTTTTPIPHKRKQPPSKGAPAPGLDVGVPDFDNISTSTQRPLHDMRRERPRRQHNVPPTVAVTVQQTEHNPKEDVGKGVDDFYKPVVVAVPLSPPPKESSKSKNENKKNPKKEQKKKGGFFSRFAKRKSTSHVDVQKSPSTTNEPVAKSTPDKPKPVLKEVPEERQSQPPTPESRSEDELSTKDEAATDEKKEEGLTEETVQKTAPPKKVALVPKGRGMPVSTNMLTEMKSQQAKKSQELLDEPDSKVNGITDKEKKPLKPANLNISAAADGEVGHTKDTSNSPDISPDKENGETPAPQKDEPPSPKENGSPGSKQTTPTNGGFVLPSPTQRKSSMGSNKDGSDGSSATQTGNIEQQEKPLTPSAAEVAKSPQTIEEPNPTSAAENNAEDKEGKEDLVASQASSHDPKLSPSRLATSPMQNSVTSPTAFELDSPPPEQKDASANISSNLSSLSSSPIINNSASSISNNNSPAPALKEPEPSSPKKQPILVAKKSPSLQEKGAKPVIGLPKKSTSMSSKPPFPKGNDDDVKDVETDLVVKETEKDALKSPASTLSDAPKKTDGKDVKVEPAEQEDKPKAVTDNKEDPAKINNNEEESPRRSFSISDRKKNLQDKVMQESNDTEPSSTQEKRSSIADKRKSFEKSTPVASPRPTVTAKPSSRPKPSVAKRPLSIEKKASQPSPSHPPGSAKKAPPVAERRSTASK